MSQRLANAVKAAREQKGWTQRELARRLRVHYTYISKIENDNLEYPPTESKLLQLAELLDLNPTQVLLMSGRIPKEYQHLLDELVLAYGEELPQLLAVLLSEKAAVIEGEIACTQCQTAPQRQG